jgi:hypothetical protein
MSKKSSLLQKIGLVRPRHVEDTSKLDTFDKRLKMVSRARQVNHAPVGVSVFKARSAGSEA